MASINVSESLLWFRCRMLTSIISLKWMLLPEENLNFLINKKMSDNKKWNSNLFQFLFFWHRKGHGTKHVEISNLLKFNANRIFKASCHSFLHNYLPVSTLPDFSLISFLSNNNIFYEEQYRFCICWLMHLIVKKQIILSPVKYVLSLLGSILEPVLYLIYVNDIRNEITNYWFISVL